MNDFIIKYAFGKSYEKCLIPDDREYLIDVKKGTIKLDLARKLAVIYDNDTKRIKDENITQEDIINKKGIEVLDKVKYDLLKAKFQKDIMEETKDGFR